MTTPETDFFFMTGPLDATDTAAVRGLVEVARVSDGTAALSGHVLENLPESVSARYLLVFAGGGDLVGIAALPAGDPAELMVTPNSRRRGLGRALVRRALQESGSVWAHGDLPPARSLATAEGLGTVRRLLQMSRAPGDLGPVALPAGVTIRTFVPGADDKAFLEVNARAFAWHPEQGRLDQAALQSEIAQDWFDPAGFFLAVDSGDHILGFHWTKVHGPELGEVYVLGVDPQSPVRGLGTPLTVAGLDYLAGRGVSLVMLYVEGDNEPALKLYRRLGFEVSGTDVVYRRP